MVGNLKVVEQVLAVGKAVSVKEIFGMVSNPRVGGTSAAVAKARTSPRVAWASPPENKIERKTLQNVLLHVNFLLAVNHGKTGFRDYFLAHDGYDSFDERN